MTHTTRAPEGRAVRRAIGVMARAPLPGRCKTRLLAVHSAEWVSGLYAAMLRDVLDGLQGVNADDYVVFVAPPAGEAADDDMKVALEVLARHVHAPWKLVVVEGDDRSARALHAFQSMFARGATYALLSGSDAPSFPTEPLEEALADEATKDQVLVGPSEDGGYHVLGMSKLEPRLMHGIPWDTPAVMEMTRLRCRELGLTLRELPKWYDVDEPSDVLALIDELRTHPERAPRTAQFMITNV